jgi:hypothetical protein
MLSRRALRLQLNTTSPPASACDGRLASFGLQDRSERLTPGEEGQDPATGGARFHSPFVHGPAGARFLYLSWRYADGRPEWVRRQKIPLTALTWERIQAAGSAGFSADVPCITERCATILVEWEGN